MSNTLRDSGTRGIYKDLTPPAYSDTSYARYTPVVSDYVGDFYTALKRWRFDTLYESNSDKIVKHPSFLEIVNMGEKIIPNIIDELRAHPDFLVAALILITNQNPVPQSSAGNLEAMANSWISWYEHP